MNARFRKGKVYKFKESGEFAISHRRLIYIGYSYGIYKFVHENQDTGIFTFKQTLPKRLMNQVEYKQIFKRK